MAWLLAGSTRILLVLRRVVRALSFERAAVRGLVCRGRRRRGRRGSASRMLSPALSPASSLLPLEFKQVLVVRRSLGAVVFASLRPKRFLGHLEGLYGLLLPPPAVL